MVELRAAPAGTICQRKQTQDRSKQRYRKGTGVVPIDRHGGTPAVPRLPQQRACPSAPRWFDQVALARTSSREDRRLRRIGCAGRVEPLGVVDMPSTEMAAPLDRPIIRSSPKLADGSFVHSASGPGKRRGHQASSWSSVSCQLMFFDLQNSRAAMPNSRANASSAYRRRNA